MPSTFKRISAGSNCFSIRHLARYKLLLLLLLFLLSTGWYSRLQAKLAKGFMLYPPAFGSIRLDKKNKRDEIHSIVQEIQRLGHPGESLARKTFRSLICCITRNDMHLREFVLRNLLAGFEHIVVYDNNQVGNGLDYDVREMLAPFISQGSVTLVPWHQNHDAGAPLANEAKNDNSRECVETYGPQADWIAVMDTDEVFYLQHDDDTVIAAESNKSSQSTALGILPRFLDDLEHRAPSTCGISFPWRMMYGEHRFLKPDGLLMDNYRRVCKIHEATKLLFRPEWSNLHGMPHGMSCTNPDGVQYRSDDEIFRRLMPEYTKDSHLIHYYQKSVEEWLVKLEQSIPPYLRYIPDSYDHVNHCQAGLKQVTYKTKYEEVVRAMIEELREAQGGLEDGGHFLGALPELTKQQFIESPERNYATYLYCKLKVAQRQEWDEEAYLRSIPEVGVAIQDGHYVDGLQHFFTAGFLTQENRGHWKTL